MHKWVFSMVKQFLPELLKKHIGDDAKITEIMADVEKQRISAFSGLLERGGIYVSGLREYPGSPDFRKLDF